MVNKKKYFVYAKNSKGVSKYGFEIQKYTLKYNKYDLNIFLTYIYLACMLILIFYITNRLELNSSTCHSLAPCNAAIDNLLIFKTDNI